MYRLIPVLSFFAILLLPSIAFAQTLPLDAGTDGGFWSFLEASTSAGIVIALIALRQIAENIAKAIPDTETGPLAIVRKIFKILSIYIPNKT